MHSKLSLRHFNKEYFKKPKEQKWDIFDFFIPSDNSGKAKPFYMPG